VFSGLRPLAAPEGGRRVKQTKEIYKKS